MPVTYVRSHLVKVIVQTHSKPVALLGPVQWPVTCNTPLYLHTLHKTEKLIVKINLNKSEDYKKQEYY